MIALGQKLVLILGGLGALLAGCQSKTVAATTTKPAETPVAVTTIVATEQTVPDEIPLTGVLDAYERTELTANATGRVLKVYVDLGQTVNAGDPIAQLDSRSAMLSAQEAAANLKVSGDQLATAKQDCDRYEGLLAKGAITQQEYDKAHGQCAQGTSSEAAAKVKVQEAAQTINDATIRAPFAGKIAAKMVHVGDYVHPDSKVVTLLADNPLRLQLTIPEPDIFAVKKGTNVRFETLGVPNREFQAQINNIGREVRAQTRDLVVEATVDNKDSALIPGMFATAHLQTGDAKHPTVPRTAIVPKDAESSVLVVVDKHLQQRAVHLGAVLSNDSVAITDGIKAGDVVVINPSREAVDGALVQ